MRPTKINAEELIFSYEIEDDRTNTYLELDDYDWMNYTLKTRFRTKKLGTLEVSFNYFGTTTSIMIVKQDVNGEKHSYQYEYPTDLFEKHIIEFMEAHIAAWNDKYAFNGEDYVLSFYNDIIEQGVLTKQDEEVNDI